MRERTSIVRRTLQTLFVLLMTAGIPAATWAQTVSRGPYLQQGTSTEVIVRWRTNSNTDSRVRYGTNLASLSSTSSVSGNRTEHEVPLSGLSPSTRYYYSVGNAAGPIEGGTADYTFVTSPPTGTATATRFWALGDSGTANSSARAVRDAFYNFTGAQDPDFWIMLGDNAYNSGTDSEYQDAVFDTYPTMLRKSVLWSTLGNHDGYSANSSNESGPYYDIFTFPRAGEAGGVASGTEAYYSFDYGNIHFICLESYETNRSTNGAMLTWLDADIQSTLQPWIIAYFHHPPYTKGSHNSDSETELIEMRENALPILEAGGVDLVLSGHSHSYERSYLLDGHYGNSGSLVSSMVLDSGDGRPSGDGAYEKSPGPSFNEGSVYITAGSSGKISGGSLNHPAMVVSLNRLGSMVVDVDGDRLDATFLGSTGLAEDTFTITKAPLGPDFAVSCSPSSFTLEPGTSTTSNCTVTALGGYSGSVSLSCAGNPPGISCAFSPASLSPTGSSTLTLSADPSAAGIFNFNVEATDGALTHTKSLAVTVGTVGGDGELLSGVPVTGLDAATGDWLHFYIDVPADATTLTVAISGGTGEPDLFVRYGAEPDDDNWDCRPWLWSTEETCTFSPVAAGRWYAAIDAYEAISGSTITATHDGGVPGCTVDADCDDGAFCNGSETCNAGSCQAGTAVSCDDGVSCTDDVCDEASDSCDSTVNNANCDNGAWCDGLETCSATQGCQAGTAPDCNDGVGCTVDSCNEGTDSCDNALSDAACDDGVFCNGSETCDAVNDCQAGSNPCGAFGCDETGDVCLECGVDADCDDGAFCNGSETCDAGSCAAGSDPCPGQTCDEGGDICTVDGAVQLTSGVTVTGLSAPEGDWLHFYIDVPADATSLTVAISGGTGEPDLFVRQGAEPDDDNWDCRPWLWSTEETCTFSPVTAGRWYAAIDAWYAISGSTITATHDGN